MKWIGRGGLPFTLFGSGGSYGWERTYKGWW